MAYSGDRAYSTYKRDTPSACACSYRGGLMEYKPVTLPGSYDISKPISPMYLTGVVKGYDAGNMSQIQKSLYSVQRDYEEIAKRFRRRIEPYKTREMLDIPVAHFGATDALLNQFGIFLAPVLENKGASGGKAASSAGKGK